MSEKKVKSGKNKYINSLSLCKTYPGLSPFELPVVSAIEVSEDPILVLEIPIHPLI